MEHTYLRKDTGFSVQFATTDHKPSIYSLLEGVWSFAAILKGIKDKIWERVYPVGELPPVVQLWYDIGLLELVPSSTDESLVATLSSKGDAVFMMEDLLEYEFSMVNQQLDTDYQTDPEKYKKLRKALGDYSHVYLKELHIWLSDSIPRGSHILDFGGGEGKYLQSVLNAHFGKGTTGVLLDKAPSYAIKDSKVAPFVNVKQYNFTDNSFIEECKGRFKAIIISEVLHVMSPDRRVETYNQLWDLLAPDGLLFILEQHTNLRLDWRMYDMTEGGSCISLQDMIEEVHSVLPTAQLPLKEYIELPTHYGVMFEKKGENQ